MRTLIIAATIFVAALFTVLAGYELWASGRRAACRALLHTIGLTAGAGQRYADAARIMERLDGRYDTSGLLAGDTLSEDTQTMVSRWVSAHRKEFPPE